MHEGVCLIFCRVMITQIIGSGNMYYGGYNACCPSPCGGVGYGYTGGCGGGIGSTFTIVVVLFILLIIIGASFIC